MVSLEAAMKHGLKNVKGIKLPLELTEVRVLEQFEGVILAEHQDPDGNIFLVKWVDREEKQNRWLVSALWDRSMIDSYLKGEVSLFSLITSGMAHFLVDKTEQRLVELRELPESYLPLKTAYHEPSLAPEQE